MLKFLRSGTEESVTRLIFFIGSLFMLIWVSYALYMKTTVPHIEIMSLFLGGLLVNKQVQERLKEKDKQDADTLPLVR